MEDARVTILKEVLSEQISKEKDVYGLLRCERGYPVWERAVNASHYSKACLIPTSYYAFKFFLNLMCNQLQKKYVIILSFRFSDVIWSMTCGKRDLPCSKQPSYTMTMHHPTEQQ